MTDLGAEAPPSELHGTLCLRRVGAVGKQVNTVANDANSPVDFHWERCWIQRGAYHLGDLISSPPRLMWRDIQGPCWIGSATQIAMCASGALHWTTEESNRTLSVQFKTLNIIIGTRIVYYFGLWRCWCPKDIPVQTWPRQLGLLIVHQWQKLWKV